MVSTPSYKLEMEIFFQYSFLCYVFKFTYFCAIKHLILNYSTLGGSSYPTWHSVSFLRPVMLLNVPRGQPVPVALAVGQKSPWGQMSPVTPSTGVDVFAPREQKCPAEQSPVGWVFPEGISHTMLYMYANYE